MIRVNCETKDSLKLTELVSFQGNLKKRTSDDIKALSDSLVNEGLMMPFAIWKHEGQSLLLDGHGRKEALVRLAVEDPEILVYAWPVIYVNAETEEDARKALLQITSSYGKITKQGVKQFTVSIPGYTAPSIAKFVAKVESKPETIKKPQSNKTVIKVRVDSDKAEQVLGILSQFSFIEVL